VVDRDRPRVGFRHAAALDAQNDVVGVEKLLAGVRIEKRRLVDRRDLVPPSHVDDLVAECPGISRE
jgi:hypothetical protein